MSLHVLPGLVLNRGCLRMLGGHESRMEWVTAGAVSRTACWPKRDLVARVTGFIVVVPNSLKWALRSAATRCVAVVYCRGRLNRAAFAARLADRAFARRAGRGGAKGAPT